MPIRLSGDFYNKTLNRFEQFVDEPLVFPILLGFLKKAAQSKELLRGAKAVIGDDDAFRTFFQKTQANLPPSQARLIQEQEAKIREKLKPEIDAELLKDLQPRLLEIELKLREKYEALSAQERKETNATIVDVIIQSRLQTSAEIGEIKKQYEASARHDRIHKYLGYTVGVVGVAASIVSWPSVWNRMIGQSSEDPAPPQVRMESSGQCLPSDVRVEIKKDGLSTLPSKGTVCLVVVNDAASKSDKLMTTQEKQSPVSLSGPKWETGTYDFSSLYNSMGASLYALPYSRFEYPFEERNCERQAAKLFKQDGSAICANMMKPICCIGSGIPLTPPNKTADPRQPSRYLRRRHAHKIYAR